MADVLTINSVVIDLVATATTLDRVSTFSRGGIPEFYFTKLIKKLAALPDSWSGKSCSLSLAGTTVFSGDVVGYVDRFVEDVGWVREYRALGIRNRADYVPVTDSNTLSDSAVFNLPGDDLAVIPAREGRNIGQIITSILTMTANATALNGYGIGAYTSLSPPTLPAATVTDLAALTVIPPYRVTVSGERILQSIEQLIESGHPNHWLYVKPDGTIRIVDQRTFTGNTVTLGATGDPRWMLPSLTRDYSDSYSQVTVRGDMLTVPVTLGLKPFPGSSSADGGLQEDFAWGAYSNAGAKAAYSAGDWQQYSLTTGQDQGTCTCTTTTATVTSSDSAVSWAANFWDQTSTGHQGIVTLFADVITGVTQVYSARVTANTALTAGGTSTLTLDRTLPATTYNAYRIYGQAFRGNIVYRKYKVSNANVAAAMQQFFPYPVAARSSNGLSAALTSTAIGTVFYSASGTPPFDTSSIGIQVDPVGGYIWTEKPTALVFGGGPVTPATDFQVFIPVATGQLTVTSPVGGGYSGTLFSVEGISRTKTVTVRDWRDYSLNSQMQTYANELLDAVKDVVVEGTLTYLGLATAYLAPGQAISIAGNGYTTGYESLALPVVAADVQFNPGPDGTSYVTTLRLSNRRARYSGELFTRPAVTGQQFGLANPALEQSAVDRPAVVGTSAQSAMDANWGAAGSAMGAGGY
jgi:hypothetical protein